MKERYHFTFSNLSEEYQKILAAGYSVMTCVDYVKTKGEGSANKKILVNRVDIDLSCKKAKKIAVLFNELEIKGTFFVRLHADEYNPFSFENYRCLKFIRDSGHEIGYHSEVVDESAIWGEDAESCLRRDCEVLNSMLGIQVKGVASHNSVTGLNNLDFWKNRRPDHFGLLYEAYDRSPQFNLFDSSFYISDSNWTYWKCYQHGVKIEGDYRSPSQHIIDGHPLVYLLIHSDTYYDEHFYE